MPRALVLRSAAWALAAAGLTGGCSGAEPATEVSDDSGSPSASTPATPGSAERSPRSADPSQPSPDPPADPALPPDPRWRFFNDDRTRYASPWFTGRHRVMIGYGCTPAPYYVPDPRCDGEGFHHGVDVALPCGMPLHSGVRARVVAPGPGTVGPAYGEQPLLLRAEVTGEVVDVLLAHARRVLVEPGDRVRRGERIARAGASGAPDGCHLHLEVRAAGGGVTSARPPGPVLRLR